MVNNRKGLAPARQIEPGNSMPTDVPHPSPRDRQLPTPRAAAGDRYSVLLTGTHHERPKDLPSGGRLSSSLEASGEGPGPEARSGPVRLSFWSYGGSYRDRMFYFCRSYAPLVDTLPRGYLVPYLEAVRGLRRKEVPSEGGE
jgi:hypothetical protein